MSSHTKRNFLWLLLVFAFLAIFLLTGCSSLQSNSVHSNSVQENSAQRNQSTLPESEVQENVERSLPPQESPEEDSQAEAIGAAQAPAPAKEPIKQPEQPTKRAIPVLYYHSISYEEGNELRIPPEEFEAHMQFLYQNGYVSIALVDLHRYLYEGGVLPEKPFVLTFDDGYEDNYTNAFPITEKYGYQGTIFMVTDWIDGTGYLKQEQLLEMSKAGWQIESHTTTHPYLNSIPNEKIKEELTHSKEVLEGLLGKTVTAFAYPYGIYDSSVIELCKETGYKLGLTTNRGWAFPDDPYQIQRVYCFARMGLDEFKRRVENPRY